LANEYVLEGIDSASLTNSIILKHSTAAIDADAKGFLDITPEHISVNESVFSRPAVTVTLHEQQMRLSCACNTAEGRLCRHQAQVMYNIVNREELRIFFDEKLRNERVRKAAAAYGLENEPDPALFFEVEYIDRKIVIQPRMAGLLPLTRDSFGELEEALFSNTAPSLPPAVSPDAGTALCVVLRQHKYYKHLNIELFEAPLSKDGKIKNPLSLRQPLDRVWKADDARQVKFFTAISRFQEPTAVQRSPAGMASLQAIVANPLRLPFYYHNSEVSEHISAASLAPVGVSTLTAPISLTVTQNGAFYQLEGHLHLPGGKYPLHLLELRYSYFIFHDDTLLLVSDLHLLDIISFFKKQPSPVIIHETGYPAMKHNILKRLEHKVHINYAYMLPADAALTEKRGFNKPPERIIYLSELGSFVMINPVIKYGEVEIPVLSKRQVFALDEKGKEYLVRRNDAAEIAFVTMLSRQHAWFREQLEEGQPYFYLHKDRFLDEEWFLHAFDEWHQQNITVMGFNEIKGNKVDPHKARINIQVISGIDWFNTEMDIRFGRKKARLKPLQRAVANKSRFVQLDDGTLGILPVEWIEKLAAFFEAGEVEDETLRTPRINFSAISDLYDEEMLSDEVAHELAVYQSRFAGFEAIHEVAVPPALEGTLRPYQREGLNWLNFLDEFNFGGCLADDMGLGKSIQVIAFILSQRAKAVQNTNLIVVPTSLVHNWQDEVKKFAPSIKMLTLYGPDRERDSGAFNDYEIILSTYGTLLSDISFLRKYRFNYVFLDESQHIKNTSSQRYRAVRQLSARNRIVITGTPMENNTFDLYGQFSFACPGLLGSKQYFRDVFAIPIDKFKDSKRAAELQQKIHPFLLRRTKQQVAAELPEKTEMTVYCELPEQQRKIYDACEKELREYIATRRQEELHANSMYVLRGLTRLRQICNSPLLLPEGAAYTDPSIKIDILLEQVSNKSRRHKILIFSQFVSMLQLIGKALHAKHIPFTTLTGSTRDRETVVKEFQSNDDVRVFLISLKAGGTGLNLTAADYVYIVDPWWNPAVENQAIDRSHRIGQEKHVMAVRLICQDTIEEKIQQLQASKKELVNELVKTDSAVLKSLSKAALLSLLNHPK
jgi:superfamily II DNA or RNA helicase